MKAIVLILCLIPLISGAAINNSTCLTKHLRNKGLLGGLKGNESTELSIDCTKFIEQSINNKIESRRTKLLKESIAEDKVNCVIEKLKKTNFFDRALVQNLDNTESTIKYETFPEKQKWAAHTNLMLIERSRVGCEVDSNFDEASRKRTKQGFYKLFEQKSGEKDPGFDYCLRKHLVDNNLISFNKDKFNVNPKNINTTSVDCDLMWKIYVEYTQDLLIDIFKTADNKENPEDEKDDTKKTWRKCFRNHTVQNKMVDKLLQFEYVKEYELTAEEKEQLAGIYADNIIGIIKTLSNCSHLVEIH